MKQLFLCCTMALLCLCVPSSVRAQIYTWGDAPVPVDTVNWKQISDLPTVFININTDSLDSWNTKYNKPTKTETYFPAHIVIVDSTKNSDIPILTMNEYCGIRLRGNSTLAPTKKPFRIKFNKKKKLLGSNFANAKSWVLLANVFDKTMIRNALTYDLGKFIGMKFCPAAKFVDLVLNGQYLGTYQITDQVQVAKKRVNVDEDKGWFMEMANGWNAQNDIKSGTDVYVPAGNNSLYFVIKNPEYEGDNATTLTDSLKNVISTFTNAMWDSTVAWKGIPFSSTLGGWRHFIAEKAYNRWFLGTEILMNVDAYTSIYLYRDIDNTKLHFCPFWDEDLGYNNATSWGEDFINDKKLTYEYGHNGECWSKIVTRQMADARYVKTLQKLWQSWIDAGIEDYLLKKIDSLAAVIDKSQTLNYTLDAYYNQAGCWNLSNQYYGSYTHTTYAEYVTDLKNLISNRLPTITSKLQEAYETCESNRGPDVTMNANGTSSDYTTLMTSSTSDEKLYFYSYLNRLTNATIANRTFSPNYWNTICLPFYVYADQMAEVFGEGYQLREFVGVGVNNNGETIMKFASPEDNDLVDGVPYLIKPTKKVTNPTFKDVVWSDKVPGVITYDGYSFVGTFYNTTMKTDGTELFADTVGNLRKPSATGNTIHGMRAFFRVPSTASGTAKIMMTDNDGDATGITEIHNEPIVINNSVYNLNGQKVGNSTQGLRKGVYIVNRKKITIK